LVRMKFWAQDKNDPAHMGYTLEEIPAAFRDEARMWRDNLLETASHACDELLECILEGKEITEEMLRRALRMGTLAGRFTPVLCGSSKDYHGVRLLMDAVIDYLPSPADRPPVEGVTVGKRKEK